MLLKKISGNFISLVIGQVLSGILAFCGGIYLARVLGPILFGKVSFAESILMFFLIFADFGLNTVGIRSIAKEKKKVSEYVSRIVSFKLLLSLISVIALLVFVFFLNKPADTKYVIVLFCLSLFPLAFFFDWVYQGLEEMQYRSIALVIREGLYLLGLVFLVRNVSGFMLVGILFLASRLAASIFLFCLYLKQFGIFKFTWDFKKEVGLLKSAAPLGLGLFCAWVFLYFDMFSISLFTGERGLGLYNAAYRPVLYGMLVCECFYMSIFPPMSLAAKTNKNLLKDLVTYSSQGMFLVWLPVAVFLSFSSSETISLIYGGKFSGAGLVFSILPWSLVILSINTSYAKCLIASGQEYKFSFIVLIRTVVMVVLTLVFIPLMGIVGAALAKVISEAIIFPLYRFMVKNLGLYISFKPLLRIIKYCTVFTLSFVVLKQINCFFSLFVSSLIYLLLIYVFEKKNLRLFMNTFTKNNEICEEGLWELG